MSRPRKGGGRDAITDHPVLELVNVKPNPSMSAMSFWEAVISQPLGFHGGFAEIVPNGLGEPAELWPIAPQTVTIHQNKSGTPSFVIRVDSSQTTIDSADMFHIHGLGLDGVTQWILHQIGSTSFGKNIATQDFAAEFFGNGAMPTGILEAPPMMKKEAIKNLITSFRLRQSGQGNRHKTAILTDGVKYQPISTDPEKSQLIEALQFGVEEVARWYRMPPNKIQHLLRSTYSNIEQENKSYVIDTLQPWSVRVCQEIRRKLLPRNPEILVEHDFSMLLEADTAAKTEALFKEFQMGMHTINDLLIYANREPSNDPKCDERFVLANIQPLKIAMESGAKNTNDATAKPIEESNSKSATKEQDIAFTDLLKWYFRKFANECEEKAARAIRRQDGLIGWMQEHYPRHKTHVADAIETPIRAVLSVYAIACDAKEIANAIADEYVSAMSNRNISTEDPSKTDSIDEFAEKMAISAINRIKSHEVTANA